MKYRRNSNGAHSAETLGAKLDVFFENAIVASFAIIRASPDAGDIIGGYNAAGRAEIRKVQVEKIEAIAEILRSHETRIKSAGLGVGEFADFIENAAIGIRDVAHDEKHLRSLLATLKATVISLAGA